MWPLDLIFIMIPLTCLLALSLSPSHSLHFAWGRKTVVYTGDQEETCFSGASVTCLWLASAWENGLSTCSQKPLHQCTEVESFHSGVWISLILVELKEETKKPIMTVEEKVTKKGLILSPQKKKNHKHLDFLFKKKNKQKELCPCVVHLGAYLLFIYCNDGSPHPRRRRALMRTQYRERSQRSARSPTRPEASWHAQASLRTHALSRVIPHLVTICHCHPWHVTPRQTDLTPMPSLTPGWEAVVIWIEITGRGWLISLWHNSNTT